jgi:hypothetical protein
MVNPMDTNSGQVCIRDVFGCWRNCAMRAHHNGTCHPEFGFEAIHERDHYEYSLPDRFSEVVYQMPNLTLGITHWALIVVSKRQFLSVTTTTFMSLTSDFIILLNFPLKTRFVALLARCELLKKSRHLRLIRCLLCAIRKTYGHSRHEPSWSHFNTVLEKIIFTILCAYGYSQLSDRYF